METMAKKQPRPRRSFTPEFKAEVVELVRQPGNTAGSVARDLKLTETAVRAWAKQADLDAGRRTDGRTSEQLSEMVRVRKRKEGRPRPSVTRRVGRARTNRKEPGTGCAFPRSCSRWQKFQLSSWLVLVRILEKTENPMAACRRPVSTADVNGRLQSPVGRTNRRPRPIVYKI